MTFPSRRRFLQASLAALATPALAAGPTYALPDILLFEKSIQHLSTEQAGRLLATAGYDGMEATVRRRGRIEPAEAPSLLPKLVDDLGRQGMRVPLIATDITSVDSRDGEKVISAAVKAGIPTYRMGHLRYDPKKPIRSQLDGIQSQLRDLAQMNRDLGITGVYQNHAGPNYVGGPVWDLAMLLDGIDPKHLGIAFDIRHAKAEGVTAWETNWRICNPHIRCAYVKDFDFVKGRPQNKPIGEGIVGDGFYMVLKQAGFNGPVSIHTPWLKVDANPDEQEVREILAKESAKVRRLLS